MEPIKKVKLENDHAAVDKQVDKDAEAMRQTVEIRKSTEKEDQD
ncbi:MAG TPA: hypothetical protein VGO93_11790 [Candidatus Xenobia bacterium]|jgi:hypothetical protein